MSHMSAARPRRFAIAAYIAMAWSITVLAVGVGHFPMASTFPAEPRFQALAPAAMDLLVLLCLCVGILLVFAGGLSLYFSTRLRVGDATARGFFLAMGALFLARTILELMHPVAIPQPDVRVLIWVFATSVVFFVAALMGWTRTEAA